jgi:hypothetical protein
MEVSELRRYPRVTVDFFADWGWGPECEYYDRITSLSISGCFLVTKRDLKAGDEIHIRWSGDRAGMITLKGAVRYQLRVVEGEPPTGVGIEFVDTSAQNQQKLQAILSQYG